jgi:isoquinoline 1-oxidoreductase alpha subunit
MATFTVNGKPQSLDIDPDTPLLWVVRDALGLTGSKFGCGIGYCGACTMHVNGKAERTCILPVSSVEGATITTIEGLANGDVLSRVQQAWLDLQVPQCGYCQSGMIMAVSALLAEKPHATSEEVDEAITNICRCGTYARIRKAIQGLTAAASEGGGANG